MHSSLYMWNKGMHAAVMCCQKAEVDLNALV